MREIMKPSKGMSDTKLENEFDNYQDFSALTDESITQEQINEMKMLGMPKPYGVSWPRWTELQGERAEHTHMIHMAASGIPQGKIAEILGYEQAHVSKVLKTPWVKEKVQEEIKNIYGADHKKALKDRALKALDVVDEVLETGKESERAAMSKWVLEHSVGKASQEIVEKKTSLTEFVVRIEQMEKEQLRDVGSSNPALSKKDDPFHNIIKELLPEPVVVGKRLKLDNGGNGAG